jgi:hypothetical protein
VTEEPAPSSPALTPEDWEQYLSERLARRVTVSYGRSRTTPLQAHRPREVRRASTRSAEPASASATPAIEAWRVRMHSMFASAPDEVRSAVVDLLASGKRASRSRPVLEDWITSTLEHIPRPRIPDEHLETTGNRHDLAAIARSLLETECREDFGDDRPVPRVTWGRAQKRRRIRGIRLGSYDVECHLVRMHPSLDQDAVPEWFVRYVLFHEFLLAIHPPVRGSGGRWVRHGPELRRREKTYPDLGRALDWERKHIDRLIRSARTEKPMKTGRFSARRAVQILQGLLFPETAVRGAAPGTRSRKRKKNDQRLA